MVARIAERVIHHHRIGHRRENGAKPILAIQPFGDEGDGLVSSCVPDRRRKQRFGEPQQAIDAAKEEIPQEDFWCGALARGPTLSGWPRKSSSMPTPLGLRAFGFISIRTKSGAITVRAHRRPCSDGRGTSAAEA